MVHEPREAQRAEKPEPDRPLRIAMSSYYLPSESKIGAGYRPTGSPRPWFAPATT